MRSGPPPTPTKLKLLRGNPGKRAIKKNEPQPKSASSVKCPAWLSTEAKKVWRRTAPKLRGLGLLTEVDGDALAAYCQTYARWKEAELFIEKNGAAYAIRDEKDRIRYMQQFPQVSIARALLQQVRGYQQEFGMTPSARVRLAADTTEPKESDDDAFRNAATGG